MIGPSLDDRWPTSRAAVGYWTGVATGNGTILPDGAAELISVDGGLPFVAGPDTGPVPSLLPAGSRVVGLRLRIGALPAAFGASAAAFADSRVSLAELVDTERLADDLGCADSDAEIAAALAAEVGRRVGGGWEPDPLVVAVAQSLRGGGRPPSIGVGERQLRRRFNASVGYGPKLYDRICRLDRFVRLAADGDRPLAQLAVEAGYYDEPHLARDVTALAGRTPGELVRR